LKGVGEMIDYTKQVEQDLLFWKRKMLKRSGFISRTSKKAQVKMNALIPDRIHKVMTESIKNMVKVTLTGSNITTNKRQAFGLSIFEKDALFKEKLTVYRRTAVNERI